MTTTHEKMKNYLITHDLLNMRIIGKEKVCYIKKKQNGKVERYEKLDLLGADEDLYYFIEIKTTKIKKHDIKKYIKIFNNFNFLHRGIQIIFVAKGVSKEAEKVIKESKCNIKIVWFKELDEIEKIEVKKVETIPHTRDLDEYRLSFILRMYFDNVKCFGKRFIKNTQENLPAIKFTFLNGYTVILYFHSDNYANIDLYWKYKREEHLRYILLYKNLQNIEFQLRYLNDLISKIEKLTDKITYDEYHDIAEQLIPLVDITADSNKFVLQLLSFK